MPGFDRTGPLGQGPMTGGGFGYCNPLNRGSIPGRPLYGVGSGGIPRGGGRGRAFGGGLGRFGSWGNNFFHPGYYPYPPVYPPMSGEPYPPVYPTMRAKDEKEYLENAVAALKEDMTRIQARLDELATSDDSK
ncbi:DUF5320 domain-containing protein [bacterium]|nr:DUF5320 domain-containing protein [bacterium]